MKTDGFFIKKETFLNYTSSTQKEILASMGLDILVDAEESMDIYREPMLKVLQAVSDKPNLIDFLNKLHKTANQVSRIAFLATDLKMTEIEVRAALLTLNIVTAQELPGKIFAEMNGSEDIVYISKTTLQSLRKTLTMKFRKRFSWHPFGKKK